MTSFSDPSAVSSYAENAVRNVPGLLDLHKMVGVLLAERAPKNARILVLGAGGGMELEALARMQPDWQFDGVDPSKEMLELARVTLGDHASRVRLREGLIGCAPTDPFDGATCLLTLHFLPRAERLETLRELQRRLKPGAPLVVAHHSFPSVGPDPDIWLKRNAAYLVSSGLPAEKAEGRIAALRERLPFLSPQQDADLLAEAGFVGIEMFYNAFTFKGWVAYRP